jgi:hypothetical protein
MLRLLCSSSGIFRALMKLRHSLLEFVRSRRGNASTILFGTLLPSPAGQRRENRLKRGGPGRIVPVSQNVEENLDTFSFMRAGGKQGIAAGSIRTGGPLSYMFFIRASRQIQGFCSGFRTRYMGIAGESARRPLPPLGTRDLVYYTVTVTLATAGSVRASAREIADNFSLYFHDFRIII